MDPFFQLHTLLSSYTEGVETEIQELYYELVAAGPLLRKLFDVPPRSSAEKNELQSGKDTNLNFNLLHSVAKGKAKISSNTLAINESFAAETVFLSESLDVSELYCAELIEILMRLDPNQTPEQRVEKAIHLFHSRRNSILMTLNLILTGANQEETSGDGDMLKTFLVGQLFQGEALQLDSGRRGGYGEKILEEIEKVGQLSSKVAVMMRDARSDTNLKSKVSKNCLAF
jgi:Nuclear pore complex scaffold, nucleoporins 186/192/205